MLFRGRKMPSETSVQIYMAHNLPFSPADIETRATALLRRFYGYSSFRPMQLDIITAAVQRRDCVVLMPTGGGKSICYQIPALIPERGITIVISPLIALMKDQVTALTANGIPAAAVNSLQPEAENRAIMEQLHTGRIRILYISPERLLMEIDRWSSDLNINLIAVDEAHCISQWGHDFRPDYTRLSHIKEKYPHVPVMALTATADRLTRSDIATQLQLFNPAVFIGSFDRPNISLRVIPNPGTKKRIAFISSMIERYRRDSGIVYCISRKSAESLHAELSGRGYKSTVYHAGLSTAERNKAQDKFINGEIQVICATIAFGMGIDKSNIRWVIHNNMPGNIESYYQEIGRAGRDGVKAEAVMFYSYSDVITRKSFVDESGQQTINSEKLMRMKEFAEASVCRRRILLSYFNEVIDHDCGNCDVCLNPPERFDGTTIAQKAMSAVVRTAGGAGFSMLADILRGQNRIDISARGFDQIKTFGAGRDLSRGEWNHYLSQLIQLGLLDIAYNENNHLKLTAYGATVLRDRLPVTLAKYIPVQPTSRGRKKQSAVTEEILSPAERLLAELKEVRLNLSRKESIPPHLIFSDKTLLEMVRIEPLDMETFSTVEGVGEKKTVKYWRPFVMAIRRFKGITEKLGAGMSTEETLLLLNAGYNMDQIAEVKGIKSYTVATHVAQLIREDKLTDFSAIITREQYLRVMHLYKTDREHMYTILETEMPKGLPNIALAISDFLLRRKGNG